MNAKSSSQAKSHHLRASGTYEAQYMPMAAACHTEFPITYLYEHVPLPQSIPVMIMHAHDVLEVGYCHSGSGILLAEDRVVPFSAGDISILRDDEMHMSRSEPSRPSRWSYFWMDHRRLLTGMPDDLEMLPLSAFDSPEFPCIFSPKEHRDLCRSVLAIVEELRARRYGHRPIVKSLATALTANLCRICRDMSPGQQEPKRTGMERIAPALHYMAAHYAEPIDVKELAKLCNLSVEQFRRVFRAAIGKPPLDYLAQVRVRMAAAILSHSKKPISQVAFEVGFESINTFNRRFRAVIGITPTQWRRQQNRH